MSSKSNSENVIPFPLNRDKDLIALMSGPVRRLARWPWYETHQAMEAGEVVSPFHARWARLSLQRLGGRLPVEPATLNETCDIRTGELADPPVISEDRMEELRAKRRRRRRRRR